MNMKTREALKAIEKKFGVTSKDYTIIDDLKNYCYDDRYYKIILDFGDGEVMEFTIKHRKDGWRVVGESCID